MRRATLAPLVLAPLVACGRSTSGVEAPVGSPGGAGDDHAITTPARWIYHPREAATPSDAMPLGDGRCVVATQEGERWLVSGGPGDRCGGAALGTAPGAPEPLRRVVRDGALLRFVGASGALYDAREPLGPFTRVVAPPEPLGRVEARGAVTIGLSSRGEPYVLAGDGWTPGDAGGARLFDVAIDEAGRALALAWPESVLASNDGGRTFRPVDPAPRPIGAIAVTTAAGGSLAVAGVRGHLLWDGAALKPSSLRVGRDDDEAAPEVRPVPLAPSAAAIALGRASLAGRRWVEVRPASELPDDSARGDGRGDGPAHHEPEPPGWSLVRGPLGGPFTAVPLAGVEEEREVRLAASGGTIAIATIVDAAADDAGARLVVRRSTDDGATFVDLARLVAPDVRAVRLAVSPRGDVLVAGACTPGHRGRREETRGRDGEGDGRDEPPCRPRAPVLLRPGQSPPRTTSASVGLAADLRGGASSPAFSPDGALAYFLGRRAKGQEPSIFVSDDGGRTWSARALRRRARDAGDDDGERASWDDEDHEAMGALDLIAEQPLGVGADGTLGFTVATPTSQAWVVAGADGEVRTIAEAPVPDAILAGIGRRALAVATTGRGITAWETGDGSDGWSAAGTLRARSTGDLAVACSSGGCVVGDALTRVGWEAEMDGAVTAPAPAAPRPPQVRTPLVCELDPRGWSALRSIELGAPFPSLDEIARGGAAWSVLGVDRQRGAATVHHVAQGGDGHLVARPLLEPANGDGVALRTSHQGEGYAVARWVPGGRALDVAWVNFFDGVLGRRSVDLPAGRTPTISAQGSQRALETGLVSVATGGLLVQPSAASRDASFVDARRGTTAVELPDWSAAGVTGRVRTDHARVGGRSVFVGTVEAGATVGLLGVRGDDGALAVEAATLAPPVPREGPAAAVTAWTYVGGAPGFVVVAGDATGEPWSTAVWRAFGADGTLGPPVVGPTLLDLPDRPRPCRADEVRTTPRVESHLTVPGTGVPLARGHRHPVIVPGAGEGGAPDGALQLLTAGAILHGTPASPCVAGWEATGIDGRRAAAVILGDTSRAWVFRLAAGTESAPARPAPRDTGAVDVEVRAMSCRWDPAAAVPEGAWDEVGVR
jgi:hypothetical protein